MQLGELQQAPPASVPKLIFTLVLYILITSFLAILLHVALPPLHIDTHTTSKDISKSNVLSLDLHDQYLKDALIEIESSILYSNKVELIIKGTKTVLSKTYDPTDICSGEGCTIREVIPSKTGPNSVVQLRLISNQSKSLMVTFRLYSLSRYFASLYCRVAISIGLIIIAVFMLLRALLRSSSESEKQWRKSHPLQIILIVRTAYFQFSCFSFGGISAIDQLLSDSLSNCKLALIIESIFRYSVLCLVLAQIPKNLEKIRKEKLFSIEHFTFNLLSFLNYVATLILKIASISQEIKSPSALYFYSLPSDERGIVTIGQVGSALIQLLLIIVSLIYSVLLVISFCKSVRMKPSRSSIIFLILTIWAFPIVMTLNVMSAYSNSLLEVKGHLGLEMMVNAYLFGLILFLFSSDLYSHLYPQNFEEIELTKKATDQQPLPLYDEDDLSQRDDEIMKQTPEGQHKERAWEIINKIAEKEGDSDSEEEDD